MTQKPMTLKAINARVIELALAESGDVATKTRNGATVLRTSGRLDNNRPATVRVVKSGEMISVGLLVPGMGEMSITFTLFADDATEERIERYLTHYLGIHKEAKAFWNASITE
jgi:hypothetical protein